MPIAKLYVEGNLESEILNPVLTGSPLLQQGGSKNALRPRARTDRSDNGVQAGYLRDRDFDFDPPSDLAKPTVDAQEHNVPFGWRWCRHELENYLLEPALVSAALGWSTEEVTHAILFSARHIRNYEAARWTVGIARRSLPPAYELETRPVGLNEIALPSQLNSESVRIWVTESIRTHRERIVGVTDPHTIENSFDSLLERFNDSFISDTANVLLWFSGKDVMAGMADWLTSRSISSPGLFRSRIRDWVRAHPTQAISYFAEWQALITLLRN